MQADTAILSGVLFAVAMWLLLQRSFVKVLLGFVVLSNAANLFVLMTSGEPSRRAAPIVEGTGPWVDPLPQALVLTAIVIGFGVTAYLVTLLYRLFLDSGTTHLDELYADEPTEREKTK